MNLNSVGLPESVLAGWQALPAAAPSPSQQAVATSAPVYLATLEDRRGTQGATPADPVDLCDALIEQSLPHNGRDDDTAILCALLA